MSGLRLLILIAGAWLGMALVGRLIVVPFLRRGPGSDAVAGLMWWAVRIFTWCVHRARAHGAEALRSRTDPGPLVVVSNHTGAIDPFLIQAACRFQIRWMMASDMMFTGLDWLWKRQRLIPVARDGTDSGPAREAIRHVVGGGVVGIFPEGRIVTPPRQVWPFQAGVGLVVARTHAPVLLVWVSGTAEANTLRGSILTPSRARVQFVDLMRFEKGARAADIAQALRERIHEVSGWPLNDGPPPRQQPEVTPAASIRRR
jgi:1-acyl-sn-glycerol-3-phosphate acyltransferase